MNLILVAIDACRGDHLHCNGYPRETSPNIDKLASEGITFTDVTPAWPYTAISYTSMITGWYPFNHKMIASLGTVIAVDQTDNLIPGICSASTDNAYLKC